MNAMEFLQDEIERFGDQKNFDDEFYFFEPWDVKKRAEEMASE